MSLDIILVIIIPIVATILIAWFFDKRYRNHLELEIKKGGKASLKVTEEIVRKYIDRISTKQDETYSLLTKLGEGKLNSLEEATQLKSELEKKARQISDNNTKWVIGLIIAGLIVLILYLSFKEK